MRKITGVAKWQTVVMWLLLVLYAAARIFQQYPDRFPMLLIVAMQVLPPGLFGLLHGSMRYGVRGMAVFAACCLGVSATTESLSLRTGFPFGHYVFTDVMGPKVMQLPVLLVLAYLGIGYCSWVLATLILGQRAVEGRWSLTIPLLASPIMVAWDVSMEAIWSTLDRAWIWRDGGYFFGVPISNFLGWYLTAFLIFLAFALYNRVYPFPAPKLPQSYWRAAIACYGICGFGNLLIYRQGLFPATAMDATGKVWTTMNILSASTLVSVLGMGSLVVLAWRRSSAVSTRAPARSLIRS